MTAKLEGRPQEILGGCDAAHLAIARADGSVQCVVVWAAEEGGLVTLNAAVGRSWPCNLQRAGRATLTILADGNPNEWVSIEGRLVQATTEGANEHRERLVAKYGEPGRPPRPGAENRIMLTLEPERIYYFKQDR